MKRILVLFFSFICLSANFVIADTNTAADYLNEKYSTTVFKYSDEVATIAYAKEILISALGYDSNYVNAMATIMPPQENASYFFPWENIVDGQELFCCSYFAVKALAPSLVGDWSHENLIGWDEELELYPGMYIADNLCNYFSIFDDINITDSLTQAELCEVMARLDRAFSHWAFDACYKLNKFYRQPLFILDDSLVNRGYAKGFFSKFESDYTFIGDDDENVTRKEIVLATSLLTGLLYNDAPLYFTDCDELDTEYKKAIATFNNLGIISSMPDGNFEPEGGITSAEMATIIYRALIKTGGVYEGNKVISDKIGFEDVSSSDWFYDGAMYLLANGIISGTEDGKFLPNGSITRAEATMLIYRAKNEETKAPTQAELDDYFSDIDANAWYVQSVWACKDYFITDSPSKKFRPEDIITRQELAYCITKQYSGFNEDKVNLKVLNRFSDAEKIYEPYRKSMAYLVSIGVLRGSAEGLLSYGSDVSRAEFGIFMARLMNGIDKTKIHDYKAQINRALSSETKVLTLSDNYYMTSDLKIIVPENESLIIDGQNQHYIYEFDGAFINDGNGKLKLINTKLYHNNDNIPQLTIENNGSDKKYTVKYQGTDPRIKGSFLYVAVFNSEDELLDIKRILITDYTNTFDFSHITEEHIKVKSYLWEDFNKPLIGIAEFEQDR